MSIDSDYEDWGGGIWNLTLSGTDHSDAFQMAKFSEALNEPIQFELKVQGIDASNTDIDEGSIAELDFGGTKAFKGRIVDSETSSDLEINLEGMGMSFDLLRRTFTKNYTGSNTDTIVSEIEGSTMSIGTNTRLNGTDDTVDFRMDEESKLVGINRLVGQYGGEWWVDEDGGGNDQLNVDTQRGSGTSQKTYKVSGADKNAEVAKKNVSAGEGNYDGVVVKGYGDGDDQIKATAGNVGDEDEVLEYTDKRITSDRAAQDKADQLKAIKVDGDWTEIKIVPGDPNEILNVGDTVTIESSDADIASADFRIVERNYSVDFQGEIRAELVCNNRPATLYDGGLAETREETKSQTRNMQGARNVWGEKEATNATDADPLTLDFYVPPDVIDQANNNRVEKVKLNYSASGYRKSGASSESTVETYNGDIVQRMDKTNKTLETVSEPSNNTDAVTVEKADINDQTHEVASQTSDAEDISVEDVQTDTLSSTGLPSSGVEFLGSVTINDTGLYHNITARVSDIGSTSNIRVFVKRDNDSIVAYQTINDVGDVNAGDFTGDTAGDDNFGQVDTTIGASSISESGTTTYSLYCGTLGGATPSIEFQFTASATTHDHNIPTNSNGVNLFDSGSSTRLVLEDDSANNFQSSSITLNDNNNTPTEFSDNTQDTTGSPSTNDDNRLKTVDESLVVGSTASEMNTIKITDPSNNTDTIASNTGQSEDQEIDVSNYVDEVGWYRIEVTPSGPTFLKTRVFMDHHKDSTTS